MNISEKREENNKNYNLIMDGLLSIMNGTVRFPPNVKVDILSENPEVAPGQGRNSTGRSKIEHASLTRLQSFDDSYSYRIMGFLARG
jgi:hypothetical protein